MSDSAGGEATRRWIRSSSAVFRKTADEFGGLSNMAPGFPIVVNEELWRTSEALYQAFRFPDHPDIQEQIRACPSPMRAKMLTKPYRRSYGRSDWDDIREEVMWWCLRAKLTCNPETFGALLESTGTRDIVEDSPRDSFWGARHINSEELEGSNLLGCLLMRLRSNWRANDRSLDGPPPDAGWTLLGEPHLIIRTSTASEAGGTAVDDQPTLF